MQPRVIGRYAVFDEVAAGGMATVHLGRLLAEAGFSRTVAIKRLHPQFARDPDFVTMFLDEARLASRIRHPNVVSTLDVVSEGDEVLLVMEYVIGESLSRLQRVSRPNPIPPPIAIAAMTAVLHGLHAAHEAKTEQGKPLELVHRDVSPQNILIGIDGVTRVLDFGVAKASHRAQTTKEGQIKGKLSYMAPEQLRRDQIDRRSDVYAAAVVLWESITGQKLFEADSEARVVLKVLEQEIERPSTKVPGLPPALDDVILKGLARDPDQRFASAREMAIALERCGIVPAPASTIGEWVESLAAETVTARAARVAEIERASDQGLPTATSRQSSPRLPLESIATLPHTPELPSSLTVTSATLPGVSKTRPAIAAIAIGAVLVLGIGGYVVATHSSQTTVAAPSHPTPPPPPTIVEPAPPPAIAEPTPAPSATPAITQAPIAIKTPPRFTAVKAPPPPPPKDRCSPPYTIDSAGIRHIKPECN